MKNAVCDVLVVQTSALDEDRMFAAEPAEDPHQFAHIQLAERERHVVEQVAIFELAAGQRLEPVGR
mgnify:CR=1 FL=1